MREMLQSSLALRLATLLCAGMGLLVAGCGQKGPLTLPKAAAPAAPASAAAPR
ncbi:LPS translocon maturation chaperone LptM [Rubrivivax sp. A210]|uniref:LPS translocon maturation chaperone LptM n=1 Tax=Rubrivivax sp. A210 TaxID=2772301 RepID=UPI00398800E8